MGAHSFERACEQCFEDVVIVRIGEELASMARLLDEIVGSAGNVNAGTASHGVQPSFSEQALGTVVVEGAKLSSDDVWNRIGRCECMRVSLEEHGRILAFVAAEIRAVNAVAE